MSADTRDTGRKINFYNAEKGSNTVPLLFRGFETSHNSDTLASDVENASKSANTANKGLSFKATLS